MPSVVALRRWLVLVAFLRLLSVYLGYLDPSRLNSNLFDTAPNAVSDLHGRTFAMWTSLSCVLCLFCAKNPQNRSVYSVTLASFVLALMFFMGELLLFKTLSWKMALQPMIVAGVSVLWMGLGYNYYLDYSAQPSEELDGIFQKKRT
jgi:hypothetical protein